MPPVKRIAPLFAAALAVAFGACSAEVPPKKAAAKDAGVAPTPTSTVPPSTQPPPFGGPTDGGPPLSSLDAGPLTGNCPVGKLCVDVSPMRPGTVPLAGRLVIMWAQLNREGPDPIAEIGYDAPFLGTETTVEITTATVTPPSDRNLLCQRNCDDEDVCPCINDPRVGVGYVVVVVDDNGNGKADLGATELESENFVGVAAVGLAFSTQAFKPAPAVAYDAQRTFANLFPQGIELGLGIHSLAPGGGGTFDVMGPVAPTARHRLPVCDTIEQSTCVPAWPNFP